MTTKHTTPGTNICQYIILHHTGSLGFDANVNYLCNNSKQVSCHYVIGESGQVAKIADDRWITHHAGVSQWRGLTNLNLYSIGIEIVSDGVTFTDLQRIAVVNLVKDLMRLHNIPVQNVLRHKDIAPGRKPDVGDPFWSNKYASFLDRKTNTLLSEQDPHKKQLVEQYMSLGSKLWMMADDEETKKRLNDMNIYFRSKGFQG